jgi:enoyl-CoA hydratase/carnithine racemase
LLVLPVSQAPALAEITPRLDPGAPILVGVDAAGDTPSGLDDLFDVLLTTRPAPPRPYVDVTPWGMAVALAAIQDAAQASPAAASIFAGLLRLGEGRSFAEALQMESFAYSTLLGGEAFRAWRGAHPPSGRAAAAGPSVRIERRGDRLEIVMIRPENRNALTAAMRDELTAALRLARMDPSIRSVELRGAGFSFSTGGDLDEFGLAEDLAMAHVIRTQRSPARLVHELGGRMTVYVQGGVIGGGVEIAAASARVVARPHAVFRLPEIRMGLLPGAGGTASIPRRIGRHRTAFMGLSGLDVDTSTALAWGLADAVAGPSPAG